MSSIENGANFGVVIAGHGSRDADGVREFEAFVELFKSTYPSRVVSHGFLEFSKPTIDEAVRDVLDRTKEKVAVVPGVLLAAMHAKNDMPSEVQALRREFPDRDMSYGNALHLHPAILRLCRERVIAAEAKSTQTVKRSDTCLVVVGRGTTDSDANSDVSKLCRMLEEGMGFGGSMVCYSGTAQPLVADGLNQAAKMGFRRLLVFPFFLFTGILVKRIYAAADHQSLVTPDVEVLKVDYLGVHSLVAEALMERARESIEGAIPANCSLCKYRTAIVGYESEVGQQQVAHHLHVRAASSADLAVVSTQENVAPTSGYVPHPIEAKSMEIIEAGRDWSGFEPGVKIVLQRLVHTSGDFNIVDDIYFSVGAVEAGLRAISRRATIIGDVTMVTSGLKRELLMRLGISAFSGVHDEETRLMSKAQGITRSAAGIRRAWEKFGNEVILAIGDAPTAVEEAVRLVNDHQWRPHLIIGLPVGFVGTRECKENLKKCRHVARITNQGTRGGSPWASTVVNALMIRHLLM